jgi:hypothetical protein
LTLAEWTSNGSRASHVAFDDEIGVGGEFKVTGVALDGFDGFLAEVTARSDSIKPVWHRRGGGEGEHRVRQEKWRRAWRVPVS